MDKNRAVLHLPKHYAGIDPGNPEQELAAVRVDRSISAMQAAQMIANQQAKMLRLVLMLSDLSNIMHRRDEIRAKAVNIAARKCAEIKDVRQTAFEECNAAWRGADAAKEKAQQRMDWLGRLVIFLLWKLDVDHIDITEEALDSVKAYALVIAKDNTTNSYRVSVRKK